MPQSLHTTRVRGASQVLASTGHCQQGCGGEMRAGSPAGGVWQGINVGTATVAWVNRPGWQHVIAFIDIDVESFGSPASSALERVILRGRTGMKAHSGTP